MLDAEARFHELSDKLVGVVYVWVDPAGQVTVDDFTFLSDDPDERRLQWGQIWRTVAARVQRALEMLP